MQKTRPLTRLTVLACVTCNRLPMRKLLRDIAEDLAMGVVLMFLLPLFPIALLMGDIDRVTYGDDD